MINRRAGFTLIELLAASAAMAVLAAGLLSVIGLLARDQAKDRRGTHAPALTTLTGAQLRVLRQIRSDLLAAESVVYDKDRQVLELIGPCGLDGRSLTRDAAHVTVQYGLVAAGPLKSVVRSQHPKRSLEGRQDHHASLSPNQRLVLTGVESFSVAVVPEPTLASTRPSNPRGYVISIRLDDGFQLNETVLLN